MPLEPADFKVGNEEMLRREVAKLLDDLLGAIETPSEEGFSRIKVLSLRLRPEVYRRLKAIAEMHKGFEDRPGTLAATLLEGFTRGFIPCPYCKHPFPPRVRKEPR